MIYKYYFCFLFTFVCVSVSLLFINLFILLCVSLRFVRLFSISIFPIMHSDSQNENVFGLNIFYFKTLQLNI